MRVVKQAKNRKENQIQAANKIMTLFLKDTHAYLKDKSLKNSALLSTIQRINRTYQRLFEAVDKKKENLTQRLFIYEYRKIRNDTATDAMAEDQFKRVPAAHQFLKSLLVHQANARVLLFGLFVGLRNSLDVGSFQLFHELYKSIRDKQ